MNAVDVNVDKVIILEESWCADARDDVKVAIVDENSSPAVCGVFCAKRKQCGAHMRPKTLENSLQ